MIVFDVDEGSSQTYDATIRGQGDTILQLDAFLTLTLTLYNAVVKDSPSTAILNGWDHVNVLPPAKSVVTYDEDEGVLTWEIEPDDNVVQQRINPHELHVALLEGTYDDGGRTRAFKHEVGFRVWTIRRVAA